MRIPVKGDVISLRGCRGTSSRTIWTIVTHLDSGFATLKSKRRKKRLFIDDRQVAKLGCYEPKMITKIKYYDNLKTSLHKD